MRSLALALSVVSMSTGCAVLAAKAPDPDRPRDRPPMCNDGKGGVVVDGLMTTTFGVIAIAMAADGEGEGAAIMGLGGLAYGLSAAAGNSSANKCRAAHDEYLALIERQEAEAAFARSGGPGGATDGTTIGGMPIAPDDDDGDPYRPVARVAQPQPQPQPQPPPQPQPQPQPQPAPVVKTTPAPRPAAAKRDDDDVDWDEFWKEVP